MQINIFNNINRFLNNECSFDSRITWYIKEYCIVCNFLIKKKHYYLFRSNYK